MYQNSVEDYSEEEEDDYVLEDEDILYEGSGNLTKTYNKLRVNRDIGVRTTYSNRNKMEESEFDDSALAPMERRFANRLRIDLSDKSDDILPRTKISSGVMADIKIGSRKAEGSKFKQSDKADRATTEQVLDPRTRIILFKLLNQNLIFEINGCISTGKEANVYHAVTESGEHRAIKIYKTSILVFKDRDRYVAGEYRFRHGYSKHNPRKMVKVWAEKEMRNLKRLRLAKILCPEPLMLRSHVLLMGFVGDKSGWAAPRLKDAKFNDEKAREIYLQIVKIMRKMYQQCKLVHGDLSEYNLLYHKGNLWVIDVSQSVEHDHPNASEFLRKDCSNIHDFFRKRNVDVMSIRDLFDFITRSNLNIPGKHVNCHDQSTSSSDDEQNSHKTGNMAKFNEIDREMDAYLEFYQRFRAEESEDERKIKDAVFSKSFIPRNLNEVLNVQKDAELVHNGGAETLIYKSLIECGNDKHRQEQEHKPSFYSLENVQEESRESSQASSIETDSASEVSESLTWRDSADDCENYSHLNRPSSVSIMQLDKQSRKAHKKQVKLMKQEKRKTKMKKSEKKIKQAQSTRRH